MSRRRQPEPERPPPPPRNNPFGGLRAGDFPAAPRAPAKPPAAPAPAAARSAGDPLWPDTPRRGKVRLRLEGRRHGKQVTLIEGVGAAEEELMPLVADLRRDLGVGGLVTDAGLELQGDQRQRAAAWLERRGYRVTGDLG